MIVRSLILSASLVSFPVAALAGPCDAHFAFDGDLADSGGNALNGQFVDSSGEPIERLGEFLPGKIGQALRFDGETIILSDLNLQTETCPQVSITAWVYLQDFPGGSHTLLSTGHGRGPRMAVSNTNLSAWGGKNEIRASQAVRPGIWIFVAGVWDYTAGVHRLYWRHRSQEEPLGESNRPPQEGLWIGAYAYGSTMMGRASWILIDDLQVHGRALSEEELHAIRDAEFERNARCDCSGMPAPVLPDLTAAPSELVAAPSELVATPPGRAAVPPLLSSCSTDNDCPGAGAFSGACYSLTGDQAKCYQRCDVDPDCGEGNTCLSVTLPGGTLDGVCTIPNSLLPSANPIPAGD